MDSSGRLIGVNTAIISGSGSSAGIGFAVAALGFVAGARLVGLDDAARTRRLASFMWLIGTGGVALAAATLADSAGSQFYFNHRPTPWLNGKHMVFGRVVDGLEVARSLRADDEVILDVRTLQRGQDRLVLEAVQIFSTC